MKILRTLLLSCASAVVMTLSATIFLGGVDSETLISPGNDKAEVHQIITNDGGGCTLVFLLDGHTVNIDEPATDKCKTYSPGQTVTF